MSERSPRPPKYDRSRSVGPGHGPGARRVAQLLSCVGLVASVAVLGGCEWNDWLYNPSTVGRWENTPTIVPVLERLDVIEHDSGEFVDVSPVTPEDLIPEPTDYTVGPGDFLIVEIFDFIAGGQPAGYERAVDTRGFIDIPQLGRIYVQGLTRIDIERAIAEAIVQAGILDDPLVAVQVPGRRQASFGIFGFVPQTGRYAINTPSYRLLDAITDAGGIPSSVATLYVIRQVPLSDTFKKGSVPPPDRRAVDQPDRVPDPAEQGQDLIDIIRDLTRPEGNPGSIGQLRGSGYGAEQEPPAISMSAFSNGRSGAGNGGGRAVTPWPAGGYALGSVSQDGYEPVIDLPDADEGLPRPTDVQSVRPMDGLGSVPGDGERRWMFLDGRWIEVMPRLRTPGSELPEGDDPLAGGIPQVGDLVTQRVIEVPIGPLMQGVAQYNIVIRPEDRIYVPAPEQGFVYVGGPGISRPGVYALPNPGRLTIKKAIIAAGGLSAIAIPERMDLTRMIGTDRQATIRLNLRAIYEGTQPDIFLKPDDEINIGTNFWATPLAIIRNGFRMTYGFGFLMDRNFGNDVFGAPPLNRLGQ